MNVNKLEFINGLGGRLDPIPREEIQIEQQKITVFSHTEESARFNRRLVEGGVDVFELTTHTRGVEDFFIERIGG